MGGLEIGRGGRFKEQLCPFADASAVFASCGDSCPLFGEPRKNSETKKNWTILLPLCNRTLSFDVFLDERRKNK